jgi:ATP:ADP antiporter, AAA family
VNRTFTRVAMTTAAVMVGHQLAAKAFRDAAFLHAWPATALPLMTIATAALTLAVIPLFTALLARFSPIAVVGGGFALSAAGHAAEWAVFDSGRAIAVIVYLHLAAIGAVLISGFWSIVAERFDPAGARVSYGRIAAAGTAGGIAGSVVAERLATAIAPQAVLVLLATLHGLCAVGVVIMRRAPALLPRQQSEGRSGAREAFQSPYVRTIAIFVVATSATAAMIDFLLKSNARAAFGSGPGLLRFFAIYYGVVQIATFLAQTASSRAMRRLGVGGAVTALPAGVAAASLAGLMAPGWAVLAALRGGESVLRNSLFRGGYELLFVPMDAATRRRAKAVLDVACDRVGEAAGSALVQLLLLSGVASMTSSLLRAAVVLSVAAVWVGRRFAGLYLTVIEDQLVKHHDAPPVSLVSEAGWTLLHLPSESASSLRDPAPRELHEPGRPAPLDPQLGVLADLRSNDVTRVTSALGRRSTFERMHVAQAINLLAWDQVLPITREALEALAPLHLGMLVDAMLDPATDFAIRRRVPRILGTVASQRSLDGLLSGLNDSRFEVRYHCGRAITRILARSDELSVDRARMIAIVERELSVAPQLWRGYRLLDRPDDRSQASLPAEVSSDQLDYIFLLLSTIVAREPLDAAVDGVRSTNPGVRGLALEYLDQVLPPAVLDRLRAMFVATRSGADVPGQSAEPPTTRKPSEPR